MRAAIALLGLTIAPGLLLGCSDSDVADTEPTTVSATDSTTTSTTVPTTGGTAPDTASAPPNTTSATERSASELIGDQAAEFLDLADCDVTTVLADGYECAHPSGSTLLVSAAPADPAAVLDAVTDAGIYDPSVTVLMAADNGAVVVVPDLFAIESLLTHVGPVPGLTTIDTDLL